MPRKLWCIFREPGTVAEIALSSALIFGGHYSFFLSIYSNAGTGAVLLMLVPLLAGVRNAVRHRRMVSPVEMLCFVLAAASVTPIVTNGDFSALQFAPLAIVWGIFTGGRIASFFCPPWAIDIHGTLPVAGNFAFIVVFGTAKFLLG